MYRHTIQFESVEQAQEFRARASLDPTLFTMQEEGLSSPYPDEVILLSSGYLDTTQVTATQQRVRPTTERCVPTCAPTSTKRRK